MANTVNTTVTPKPNPSLAFGSIFPNASAAIQGPSPVAPKPSTSPVAGLVNTGITNNGIGGTASALYGPSFDAKTGTTTTNEPFSASMGNNIGTTPANQNSSTVGLLNPHASLASSLQAGPVTSITTNPDGTTTTKHATPENLSDATVTSGGASSSTPSYAPGTPQNLGTGTTTTLPSSTVTPSTFTTPSGAVVNSQGGLISAPTTAGNPYTAQVATAAGGNAAIGQQAANIASDYGKQIAGLAPLAGFGAGGNTGTSGIAQGNALLAQNSVTARQNELATAEQAALTGTGQQLTAQNNTVTGLNNAASLAQPIQVPYSNQLVNPTTGQSIDTGGGSGNNSLPASAQNFVTQLAQQVQNGQMTRSDAEGELSSYGPAGLQALNTALGSNFNTNASNASAATTATGQALQTAATSANSALDTLSSSFASLPGFSTGGIPATNSLANWIEKSLGSPSLAQYQTNLDDARSQLVGVLNSSGGTPTGNEATAEAYLPDNMTVAQFNQNVGTAQNPGIVRQLIAQKVSAFTGSGSQSGSSGTNSASGSTPMFGNFNG